MQERTYGLLGRASVSVTMSMVLLHVAMVPSAFASPQAVAVGVPEQEDQDFPGPRRGCQDQDPECEEFAAMKECENNPTYMEVSCARTCGTCVPESSLIGCEDERDECSIWGEQGECEANPAFMNVNCPSTCKACPPARPEDCVDRHEYCFLGSLLGLCRIRPSFYLIFCGDSCRKFITACKTVPSSTVRDLCNNQARGIDIDCGRDPSRAIVQPLNSRRKRSSGTAFSVERREQNTTLPDLFKGLDESDEWSKIQLKNSDEQLSTANLKSRVVPTSTVYGKIYHLLNQTISFDLWHESAMEGENIIGKNRLVPELKRSVALATAVNCLRGKSCNFGKNARYKKKSVFGDKMNESSFSQGQLNEELVTQMPFHNNSQSRLKRQFPLPGDETTNDTLCAVSFPVNIPLPLPAAYRIVYIRINVCTFIIGLIPIFIKEIIPDPETPEETTTTVIPPPVITFPTPPSTSPSSPSATTTNPSTPPTTLLTPTPLPLPSVEARVRAVIPFCTGAGYLSLVQRLQRLVNRNNGRPLSPVAALLASGINYCKYGLGTPENTVGKVPGAPLSFQIPADLQILLNDDEAQVSSSPPKRWPGISHPALYLYQGNNTPPPAVQSIPRPPLTDFFNDTVIFNTATLSSGMLGDDGSEGTAPEDVDGDIGTDKPDQGFGDGDGVKKEEDTSEEENSGPQPVTETTSRNRSSFSCGGALISPYHILTAAHCLLSERVSEDGTPRFLKPSVVRLGEVDFERVDESQAFDYKVEAIQVHEGYALPARYNDIAIITVKDKVEFTSALRPYCLPKEPLQLDGRVCTVSGWGRTPGGTVSTVLHELNVEIVSQSECNAAYFNDAQTNLFFQADYPEGITNRLLCAGKINDVCRGDSGGPLVLNEGGIMQEVGVVSTGYGCGEARFPSIYTRVDQYTQWITNELFSGCT